MLRGANPPAAALPSASPPVVASALPVAAPAAPVVASAVPVPARAAAAGPPAVSLPPPPPPPSVQDTRAELELIDGADSIAAEDVDDAEEQAQADEEAEAAAAEALVETTLEMVDAKKCGLCYEWFEAEQMRWDAEPYCYVCKDDEACTARRPGARGRKRARREGSYASMSRGA